MIEADTRRCVICKRLLTDAVAAGKMTSTMSSPQSGKGWSVCSSKCWKVAMKRIERMAGSGRGK